MRSIDETSPSPSGRRWREAPDEGGQTITFVQSRPHPALRATLSRREGNCTKLGFRGVTATILAALLLASVSFSAVSVDRLKAHVYSLADPKNEGRHAGTPGAAAAADYISKSLADLGVEVQRQDFGGRRTNIVGKIGTADRYIILGAHYDGQGAGMPSASDNAAG